MDKESISILTIVQIILVLLKVFKQINISWWVVFIPTFIQLGIGLIAIIIMIVGLIIAKRELDD